MVTDILALLLADAQQWLATHANLETHATATVLHLIDLAL